MIVPQVIIAGPFIALLGLPVTLTVGGLVGQWEIRSIVARGIFTGPGFWLATLLVVLFTGGPAEDPGPFLIFLQLVTGVAICFRNHLQLISVSVGRLGDTIAFSFGWSIRDNL